MLRSFIREQVPNNNSIWLTLGVRRTLFQHVQCTSRRTKCRCETLNVVRFQYPCSIIHLSASAQGMFVDQSLIGKYASLAWRVSFVALLMNIRDFDLYNVSSTLSHSHCLSIRSTLAFVLWCFLRMCRIALSKRMKPPGVPLSPK